METRHLLAGSDKSLSSHAEGVGPMEALTKAQILEALTRLDEAVGRRGTQAELYLVGGAVMCIALDARASILDVDGWFTEAQAVRAAAPEVAEETHLPLDWLNDAAKASCRPARDSSAGGRLHIRTSRSPTIARCSPEMRRRADE